MANRTITLADLDHVGSLPANVPIRVIDNGDGSYSLAVVQVGDVVQPPVNALPNTAAEVVANGEIELAAGEEFFIQNTGIAPIAVKFGTGAGANSYHFILAGGTAAEDGKGQAFSRRMGVGVTISYAFLGSDTKNAAVWKW